MAFVRRVTAGAVVTVRDYKSLLQTIRETRANGEDTYIAEFVYDGERPLTPLQWLRIPRYARGKVSRPGGFGDSVDFLESLYALEDARPTLEGGPTRLVRPPQL